MLLDESLGDNSRIAISLVSGCFALITALVPTLDRWRQRRDADQKTIKELEIGLQRVVFWKSWLDACSSLKEASGSESIQAIARQNLLRVAAQQELRQAADLRMMIPSPSRPIYQRLFLLYKPLSLSSWIARICFYASFAYLLVSVWKAHRSDFVDPLFMALLFILIGFILLFHFIASRGAYRLD
jgi:hypothetical protein